MQRQPVSTVCLLATLGLTATACAGMRPPDAHRPLTNSPAARQTANSTTVDLADAFVTLSATEGNTAAGELRFTVDGQGLRVMGTMTGLTPNSRHGIHIHENAGCIAPDASSAGGHFNPLGNPHGAPGPGTHVGDLGNINANHAGVAYIDIRAPRATLNRAAATNITGRAVIVHANPDDLNSQPSGNSGARIACGVIASSKR